MKTLSPKARLSRAEPTFAEAALPTAASKGHAREARLTVYPAENAKHFRPKREARR